jgi:hypothetical protein
MSRKPDALGGRHRSDAGHDGKLTIKMLGDDFESGRLFRFGKIPVRASTTEQRNAVNASSHRIVEVTLPAIEVNRTVICNRGRGKEHNAFDLHRHLPQITFSKVILTAKRSSHKLGE